MDYTAAVFPFKSWKIRCVDWAVRSRRRRKEKKCKIKMKDKLNMVVGFLTAEGHKKMGFSVSS